MALLLLAVLLAGGDDPVPIRREFVPADKLPAAGALIKLTRADFEAKVGAAAAAVAARKNPPRLVAVNSSARLEGSRLSGSSRWTIRHVGPGPGVMPAEPLSLGVVAARWADGRPAVVGEFHPRSLGLLVEATGEQRLTVDWTDTGTPTPEGLRFEIERPTAAIVTLDLDLPAGREPRVAASQGSIIDRRPTAGGREVWSIVGAADGRLTVTILEMPRDPPLIVLRPNWSLDVATGPIESTCACGVEVRGQVRELRLETDLQVTELTAEPLARWERTPGGVRLIFRESIAATTVTLRGWSNPPAGQPHVAPYLRGPGAVVAGETIDLVVARQLALLDWSAGSFGITDGSFADNGQQTLQLQSPWQATPGPRPTFRVGPAVTKPDVVELATWQIEPDRQWLTVQWTLRPNVAPLTTWSVIVPAPWLPDSVQCAGHDPVWTLRNLGEKPTLRIEFDRALPPGEPRVVSATFRAGPPPPTLPFPDLSPLEARSRLIRLQVRKSPRLEARASPGTSARRPVEVVGPSPDSPVDARFDFYGGPVVGSLEVRPRDVRLDASVITHVQVERNRSVVRDITHVMPIQGVLDQVWLWTATNDDAAGSWRSSPAGRWMRFDPVYRAAQLLAPASIGHAGLAAVPGAMIVGKLDQPTSQPIRLEREVRRPAIRELPLPSWAVVRGRTRPAVINVSDPGRLALLARSADRATLTRAGAPSSGYRIDDPRVIVNVEGDRLVCVYRAAVASAEPRRVAYHLPASAKLLSQRVGGQAAPSDPRGLPIPADSVGITVELSYLITAGASPAQRLHAAPPEFDGAAASDTPLYEWRAAQGLLVGSGSSVWLIQPWSMSLVMVALGLVAAGGLIVLRRRPRVPLRRAATLAVVVTLVGGVGRAIAPEPIVVYYTTGDTVWAPPALMQQLDELSRPEPIVAAVATRAIYEVATDGPRARVTARWEITSFRPDARFCWPSGGAAYSDVKLDGAAAFPTVIGDQVCVTIAKPGRSILEATMTLPIESVGVDRSARLSGPEVWSCQLRVALPPNTTLTAPTIGGSETTRELGRAATIDLRWREVGAARPLRWRDGWVWQLDRPAARLDGVLRTTRQPGADSELVIHWPEGLEPLYVKSQPPGQVSGWTLDARTLRVRLSEQAVGPVALLIGAIPTVPLAIDAGLPLPEVEGSDSAWAWHSAHGELEAGRSRGAAPMEVTQFLGDYFALPGTASPLNPSFALRRAAGPVSVRVRPRMPAHWRGDVRIDWRLRPRRADLLATADFEATGLQPALIECEVPAAVKIVAVAGPHVADWDRNGNRLIVWLDRPRSKTHVSIHGMIPRAAEEGRFDVPIVRWLDTAGRTSLYLFARTGWDLAPVLAQNVTAVEGNVGGRTWAYTVDKPTYRLSVLSRPTAAGAEYRLANHITRQVDRLVATTTIDLKSAGEARGFGLNLPCSLADEVSITAPGANLIELASEFGVRRWRLDLPSGRPEVYRATVTVRAPAATTWWWVPIARLDTGDTRPSEIEHQINLAPGVNVIEEAGLTPRPAGWKVSADDARLAVE